MNGNIVLPKKRGHKTIISASYIFLSFILYFVRYIKNDIVNVNNSKFSF